MNKLKNSGIGAALCGGMIAWVAGASGTTARGQEAQSLLVVPSPRPGNEALKGHEKLSPSLVATLLLKGKLVGADAAGNPVIASGGDLREEIRLHAWAAKAHIPTDSWKSVTALRLSYEKGHKPNSGDLESLGLKLVDDYNPGDFMTVEPVNNQIDTALIDKLESHQKVQHVAPSSSIKATQ